MAGVEIAGVVVGVVVPIGIAVFPKIWEEIRKFLKGLKRTSAEDNENLSCIRTIIKKLKRFKADPSWTNPSIRSLVAMLQSQKKMIENRSRGISKCIKSIAVTMRILENKIVPDEGSGMRFYQKRQENLCTDLLAKLRNDNLSEPVRINTEDDYNIKSTVNTYQRIRYVFQYQPALGYPRTLTISSSVTNCIEHLLRWLRDFALSAEETIVRGSIDVALYEVFTEILPQVLMAHLRSRSFGLIETKQFHANVCFLRSFSVSSTFKAIQGEAGLKLEDEEKISFDLRDTGWTTWNDLQQRIDVNITSIAEVAGKSSHRAGLTTGSESEFRYDCDHCRIYIVGDNQVEVDRKKMQHSIACAKKRQQLNDCPVCQVGIGHLSPHEKRVHINACLDARLDRREELRERRHE